MRLDGWDVLVLAGLLGLGAALFLAWGWMALLGYVSALAMAVGLAGAFIREGR